MLGKFIPRTEFGGCKVHGEVAKVLTDRGLVWGITIIPARNAFMARAFGNHDPLFFKGRGGIWFQYSFGGTDPVRGAGPYTPILDAIASEYALVQ